MILTSIRGTPPPFMPGNAGFLYAGELYMALCMSSELFLTNGSVAYMAAGWNGSPNVHAPGFPKDGTWDVQYEGLRKAL